MITNANFRALLDGLLEFGEAISPDRWKTDHERAMKLADFEELIASTNNTPSPFFKIFQDFRSLQDRHNAGSVEDASLTDRDLSAIVTFGRFWDSLRTFVNRQTSDYESEGFKVTGFEEFRRGLDEVATVLQPIVDALSSIGVCELEVSETAYSGLADSDEADFVSPEDPEFELVRRMQCFAAWQRERWPLPNDLIDDEGPVDDLYPVLPSLPLPGQGVRIQPRVVDHWPIDPPITWRVRE